VQDEIIDQEVKDKEPNVTRSGRMVKKPAYLENCALSAMSYSDDNPQSYCQMAGRSDGMKWRNVIKRRAREQNLAWRKKTLGSRWVFATKRNTTLYDLEIIGGMKE
jgi:hypothetical protein